MPPSILFILFIHRYKKNLKAFYIVHPTFWTKMMTWWFTTFMAPAIKAKVHSLPGVEHLYAAITKDQLEIPAYITEYDMTVCFCCISSIFFDFTGVFFCRSTVFITSNQTHRLRQHPNCLQTLPTSKKSLKVFFFFWMSLQKNKRWMSQIICSKL